MPVISVQHLSKTYRLGQIGTGAFTIWALKDGCGNGRDEDDEDKEAHCIIKEAHVNTQEALRGHKEWYGNIKEGYGNTKEASSNVKQSHSNFKEVSSNTKEELRNPLRGQCRIHQPQGR